MTVGFTGTPAQAPTYMNLSDRERPQASRSAPQLTPKVYAYRQVMKRWDSPREWRCLRDLWQRESNWNHKADNPTSSAFGIAQMLRETSTDPQRQIDKGIRYIIHRYQTPCNAWTFWQNRRWY